MDCVFNINVCRVCMKNQQSCDLWSDNGLLQKFEFTTRLRVAKGDNLPKAICSRCTTRLKVAYTFIKTAHESERNLKTFLEKINSEFKEVSQGNNSNKRYHNEQPFSDDDILSLMDEENTEDVIADTNVNDKNIRKYRRELEDKSLNKDDVQNLEVVDLDKCKDEIDYSFSKDILLIHASSNEFDSECESTSHFMEIPTQDDDGKEDHGSENNQICTSVINILDANGESEIRCQSVELEITESVDNHEYDTIINSQDDTLHGQNSYIDESTADGTNQTDHDDYNMNNPNEEEHIHENLVKEDENNKDRETVTETGFKKEFSIHRFYCDKCRRDFSTKTNLNRHLQSHEGNRPFSCTECKKSFTQKSTLKQHMYTHTGERPYVCEVCSRGFTQCKSLIFHMRRHTGEKPFHCEYCLITFRQKDALRIHILKHHVVIERTVDGIETYSCIICQRKFDTNIEFKTHMKFHTATGEVDNTVELFRNEEENLLTKRINKSSDIVASTEHECFNAAIVNVSASSAAAQSRPKKFQCRICFKCFALKKSLARHMRIHCAKNDDYLLECLNCDMQFLNAAAYQEHLSVYHHYTCSACPELVVFKTIQELKIHMFDHELDQQKQ